MSTDSKEMDELARLIGESLNLQRKPSLEEMVQTIEAHHEEFKYDWDNWINSPIKKAVDRLSKEERNELVGLMFC
jgi:hypothetical protein